MTVEKTLSIVKPDAVSKNVIGEIISRFEKGGLRIAAAKMMHLSQKQAEEFYAVHKERPFFPALVSFMSSGPVLVQVLEGEDAIAKNRQIMGANSIDHNAVHGSDAPETAKQEIAFFFKPEEMCAYVAESELA
jgi:nucleoside-diphosphate kinase